MSSANIEIVFEGPAVAKGILRATFLAEALTGASEVFTRTNRILNGADSEAVVLVRTDFKRGSFVVQLQLVQSVTELANQLVVQHPGISAASLAAIVGLIARNKEALKDSVIDLYKWLKGKKPEKATSHGNTTELTVGINKKQVTSVVYNLYGDSVIRAGLEKLTGPMRQGAIDRIAVKHNGTEQTAIEKSEAEYFHPEPMALELADFPTEGERDTVLVVSKLSFKEGTTWTFFERGAIVVAKIEDEEFWNRVHQHKWTFGEGDSLKVRLCWKIERKKTLTQRNRITNVYELIERPKQMRLEDIQ